MKKPIEESDPELKWLEDLKVGDDVAVRYTVSHFGCEYSIETVEKISKRGVGGTLVVAGVRYDRSIGVERGKDFHKSSLEPVTDIVRAKIRRCENEEIIRCTKFEKMSDEDLQSIVDIISRTHAKKMNDEQIEKIREIAESIDCYDPPPGLDDWHDERVKEAIDEGELVAEALAEHLDETGCWRCSLLQAIKG